MKNLGDGLMVTFSSAVDGLGAAVGSSNASNATPGQAPGALEVRVGINVGEAIKSEEDYFGTPVNIARRLCDEVARLARS